MSATSNSTLNVNATSAENIARLVKLLPANLRTPRVGIVCGSGLSTLAESITDCVIVPYSVLEGFGESTGEYLTSRAERFINAGISLGTSQRASVWKSRGRAGCCDAWTSASVLLCLVQFLKSSKSSTRMKAIPSRPLCIQSVSCQILVYKI